MQGGITSCFSETPHFEDVSRSKVFMSTAGGISRIHISTWGTELKTTVPTGELCKQLEAYIEEMHNEMRKTLCEYAEEGKECPYLGLPENEVCLMNHNPTEIYDSENEDF